MGLLLEVRQSQMRCRELTLPRPSVQVGEDENDGLRWGQLRPPVGRRSIGLLHLNENAFAPSAGLSICNPNIQGSCQCM